MIDVYAQPTREKIKFYRTASKTLTITNMTATAKGTVEKPGKHVKQKAGLNRAILDTAPGGFLSNLALQSGGSCVARSSRWKPVSISRARPIRSMER